MNQRTKSAQPATPAKMKIPISLLLLSLSIVRSFSLRSGVLPRRALSLATSRINTQIEVDSPKVVHTVTVNAGEKVVICRCWKSAKFPLCDGAHNKHNKETNDNIAPCIVIGGSGASA